MCGKLLSALRAMLYNLLYTSIANLRWGEEMHFLSFVPAFPGSRFPAFPGSRVFLVLRFPRRGPCFEFIRFERMAYQAGNRPARPALISAVCSFIRFNLQSVFSVVVCIASAAIKLRGKKIYYENN